VETEIKKCTEKRGATETNLKPRDNTIYGIKNEERENDPGRFWKGSPKP